MRVKLLLVIAVIFVLSIKARSLQKKAEIPEPFQVGEAIDLDKVIPANERGILCLTTDDDGRVFGGTTGRAAHLFVYDPTSDEARSLIRLEGGIGFAYALIQLPDGSLIAGTQADPTDIAVETDEKAVGWLYRFRIDKSGKVKTEKLGRPVEGQGIYTLAYDKATNTIFGNTWPDGHFFTYDMKAGKFTDHGAIAGYRPFETPKHAEELNKGTKKNIRYSRQVSRAIIVTSSAAYTGGKDGYLFKFDFKTKNIAKTKIRLPAVPGREAWTSLDVAVAAKVGFVSPHPNSFFNTLVVAGTSEGHLFEIAFPGEGVAPVIESSGFRPFAHGHFAGLVELAPNIEANPRTFWGVGGTNISMPRAFALQEKYWPNKLPRPHSGSPRNINVFPGKIPKVAGALSMVGFGAITVDDDGNIYAGEKDRIARLIRYSLKPSQKKIVKTPPPETKHNQLGPPPEENLTKLKGWVVFAPEGTTTDGSGYTAIEVGLDGTVYVGSARYGGYAWLLCFDPDQDSYFMERLVNMQQLTGERLSGINTQGKIHAIIIIGPDGRVWFATKQAHEIFGTRPEYGEDPNGYPGGHLCYYDPKTGFSRSVGILKKQEGLMAGAMDQQRNKLYYRSEPKNHFLTYDINSGEVQDRGHTGNNCRYFAIDKDGAVYSTARGNYLSRYDPKTGYVEDLEIVIDGPGYYSAPYVIALGPNGKLYGAGIRHPWIMEFDIANYQKGLFPKVTMRNIAPVAPKGMPVYDIHAGVFGKDDKFYYPLVTNGPTEKGGKAQRHLRIMRFDPQSGKTETVGIPDVSHLDESKVKHVYMRDDKYQLDHIQGAKVGADGTLYLMDIYPQLNVVRFPQLTAPKKARP